MTPEQERKFYELFEHVVETKSMVSSVRDGLKKHIEEDAEADGVRDERVGKLEKHQTRLYAVWAAACVIVPAVSWFLVALGKGPAH